MSSINKVLLTFKELKKTAYHHYGNNFMSIIRFLYVSVLRLNTFIVYQINLDSTLPSHGLDPDFHVIRPSIDELNAYRNSMELTREFFYDKLHGISNCYLVLCGNEVAYIHWVYVKGDPNRFLILSDDSAELNYNTTIPKFRGRGLMAKMMLYIFHDLKQHGFKRAFGVIHEDNIPAIKSARRAGFQEITRIKTLGPINRKLRV